MASKKIRRRILREELFKTQLGKCIYCGLKMDMSDRRSPFFATIDHILPKSKGGRWEKNNLTLCHQHCNQKKSNKLIIFNQSAIIGEILSLKSKNLAKILEKDFAISILWQA